MARDHAQITLTIWDDEEFRDLGCDAQLLYFALLTNGTLSYCGVADWRPARLTGLSRDWDLHRITTAAAELIDRLFIVADEGTEEVLLRSFIRNDGLMKQPKMASAMAAAYSSVGSKALREVIVHELVRLHEDHPELNGWHSEKATALLSKPTINPSVYPCGKGSVYPSVKGSPTDTPYPSGKGSVKDPPTPTPTPTPTPETSSQREERSRSTPTPDHLKITDTMTTWAVDKAPGIDLERETERFLDHHRARGSTFKNWTAAWRTWMTRASDYGNVRQLPGTASTTGRRQQIHIGGDQWRDVTGDEVTIGMKTRWV